ncbi:MAG: decarboxylase [Desulfurococcaceae archaeon]
MCTSSYDYTEVAKKLYGLEHYIRGDTLTVDDNGYLVIKLGNKVIRINDLMDTLKLDIAYIRILPLIEKTMNLVFTAFNHVSELLGFKGTLRPVYPMKVNPTPRVVEAIFRYGEKYNWGFNAGSHGEVKLLKHFSEKYGSRILIYDGVITEKIVEELVELRRRGWRIVADVESEHDAEVLAHYPEIEIGLRIKPIVKLQGKWSSSVGLGSKFGMTTNTVSKILSDYRWLTERAVVLHMHPGSQIHKLSDLRKYFNEVVKVYLELKNMGFDKISIVDPGGGIAYPYVDVRDGSEESPDYTVVDYFKELLSQLVSLEPHPDIAFEGGRFIVSAHRLVVAKVVDVRPYSAVQSHGDVGGKILEEVNSLEDAERLLSEVKSIIANLKKTLPLDNSKRELYEDLVKLVREDLVHKLAELIRERTLDLNEVMKHRVISRILTAPSKRYVLSMSIFADVPDVVLVDQYFQVVPTQRLNEPPDVLASLSDLTCDSMGEIASYISPGVNYSGDYLFTRVDSRLVLVPGLKLKLRGVPLHLPSKKEKYYVAFLDTGAYQDTLAMKHNLIYGATEIIIDYDQSGDLIVEVVKHEDLYT